MNFIRKKHKSIHFSYLAHLKMGGGEIFFLDSQKKKIAKFKKVSQIVIFLKNA